MNNMPTNRNAGFLAGKVNAGRTNMILIFAFTLINIALLFVSGTYFLFSAFIPYFIASTPMAWEMEAAEDLELLPPSTVTYVIFIGIAVILTLPYLLSFILSKKHPTPWFIVALVCISLDTVGLIFMTISSPLPFIVDYLFHGWMIWTIISGLTNSKKLKAVTDEMAAAPAVEGTYAVGESAEQSAPAYENPAPLRRAGTEEKIKVFLEADSFGHHIVYRKYGKKLEELVIDDMVYSEYELKGLITTGHEMGVRLDGHEFHAGMFNNNYIAVDGVTIKTSIRWS